MNGTWWPQTMPLEFPAQLVSSSKVPESLPSSAQLLRLLPGTCLPVVSWGKAFENLPSYYFPRYDLSFTSWVPWASPSCREGFNLEDTAASGASSWVSPWEDFCKIGLWEMSCEERGELRKNKGKSVLGWAPQRTDRGTETPNNEMPKSDTEDGVRERAVV